MRDRQTCVGCGKKSPETETNYTLISAQFGWRLTRYQGPDGSLVVEWRCPTCWRDFKRARSTPASGHALPNASPSPPPEPPTKTHARRTPVAATPMMPLESLRLPLPGDTPPRRVLTPVISPVPTPPPSEPASSRTPSSSKPRRRGGSSE